MLTTLDRYLLKKLLLHTLLVGLALGFLFFMAASFRLLQHEGLSLAQVSMAAPLVVPFLLPYMLPVTYVIALTLVYGRMVADGEATAFASLGVSPLALAWPAIQLSVVLYLVAVALTTTVVPYCYRARRAIYEDSYLQLVAAGEQGNLTLSFPHEGLAVFVRSIDEAGLEGVVIRYSGPPGVEDPGGSVLLLAERGRVARDASGQTALRLTRVRATYFNRDSVGEAAAEDVPQRTRTRRPPVRASFQDLTLKVGSLGKRHRLKASAYSSAELRRRMTRFERDAAVGGDSIEVKIAAFELDEARRELVDRAVTAGSPVALTLLIIPLVFWLRARSPLVPLAVGLAASALLFFAPHMVGGFLSERLSSPVPIFLSWGTSGLAGAFFWYRGRRA